MTDDQRRVRSDSDELLDAVRALKEAEQRKRKARFSSDEFHQLASDVERQAIDVWNLASRETTDGAHVPSSGDSVEDVKPAEKAQAPRAAKSPEDGRSRDVAQAAGDGSPDAANQSAKPPSSEGGSG